MKVQDRESNHWFQYFWEEREPEHLYISDPIFDKEDEIYVKTEPVKTDLSDLSWDDLFNL